MTCPHRHAVQSPLVWEVVPGRTDCWCEAHYPPEKPPLWPLDVFLPKIRPRRPLVCELKQPTFLVVNGSDPTWKMAKTGTSRGTIRAAAKTLDGSPGRLLCDFWKGQRFYPEPSAVKLKHRRCWDGSSGFKCLENDEVSHSKRKNAKNKICQVHHVHPSLIRNTSPKFSGDSVGMVLCRMHLLPVLFDLQVPCFNFIPA